MVGSSVIKADRPELSLFEFQIAPGGGAALHLHKGHSDSFYVLEGELEFRIGEETVHATPAVRSGSSWCSSRVSQRGRPPGTSPEPPHARWLRPVPARARRRSAPPESSRTTPSSSATTSTTWTQPSLPWMLAPATRTSSTRSAPGTKSARPSKVFGMPCVKRSGRVVFGFSRTGMVFKLTDPDGMHALCGARARISSTRPAAARRSGNGWSCRPAQADEWEALAYEGADTGSCGQGARWRRESSRPSA